MTKPITKTIKSCLELGETSELVMIVLLEWVNFIGLLIIENIAGNRNISRRYRLGKVLIRNLPSEVIIGVNARKKRNAYVTTARTRLGYQGEFQIDLP